jgi:hypothetical protein
MKKLIKMLQFAHAYEVAAYHAYEGHWRSVTNRNELDYLSEIDLNELDNIDVLEDILRQLGADTDWYMEHCAEYIGEFVGLLCYHTGWNIPKFVTKIMDRIGMFSYSRIATEALRNGLFEAHDDLMEIAGVESEHDRLFERLEKAE